MQIIWEHCECDAIRYFSIASRPSTLRLSLSLSHATAWVWCANTCANVAISSSLPRVFLRSLLRDIFLSLKYLSILFAWLAEEKKCIKQGENIIFRFQWQMMELRADKKQFNIFFSFTLRLWFFFIGFLFTINDAALMLNNTVPGKKKTSLWVSESKANWK